MRAARTWLIFLATVANATGQDQFAQERADPKSSPPKAIDKSVDPAPKPPEKFGTQFVPKQLGQDFAFDLPEKTPAGPRPVPPVAGTPPSEGVGPLTLPEVLRSVEEHYPVLRAAEQERAIAGGRMLSAMGAFDTNFLVTGNSTPVGTFESHRYGAGISQAFASTGARVFSNYRAGYGDFPIYYGDRKTAEGGEFRGGVMVPLLRDREIDRARANLQQAQFNREAVEPFVERQRLDFHRAAARVYWSWVAAGERVKVVRTLVGLAEVRDKQINQLIEQKLSARIDRADNLQNLLGRNSNQVESEQAFVQASIELSLFLRDGLGRPVLATFDRLPTFPDLQEPDPTQLGTAVQFAVGRRPELRRLALQQQVAEVEARLARNQTQPALNWTIAGVSDVGPGKPKTGPSRLDRSGFEVGFELQAPLQFSEARGREMAAAAQLQQLAQQYRFQEDAIKAEVQSTFIALERSFEQAKVASERVRLARQVAEGERLLFQGGLSELMRVNIREQASFDAEIIAINAKQSYFRSLAEYKAALGMTEP